MTAPSTISPGGPGGPDGPDTGQGSRPRNTSDVDGGGSHPDDDGTDIWPPDSYEPLWDRFVNRLNPQAIVTTAIVVACMVFVFVWLEPSQLFKNTTPTGGDMGAHVWLPAYVKRALIPHLHLTGWTPDWYDGFPALSFYFPLPMYLIAFVSYVIPYNIAFKLITVLGLVTLPLAAWAFGRLARLRFPGPACLAVATIPFLFGREFTIYGGNIASTMAGEFSFSISLSLALVYLGLVAKGLRDGKHRGTAAFVLACCGLCHILPLFFALGGTAVMVAMSLLTTFDLKRLFRWALPAMAVGGGLIAFWALPFYDRLPYATNMGYGKITDYIGSLFPHGDAWLAILAALGFMLAVLRGNSVGVFLGLMCGLAVVVFLVAPPARLWNARVLPFWFLCLYLLAGVALMELGTLATELASPGVRQHKYGYVFTPVVVLLIAMIWVNFPLRNLPFGHTTSTGKYSWLGITSSDNSFIPDWVNWNYSGYQTSGKPREKEYFALIDEMQKLGQNPAFGCGRAMWEYEPSENDFGTPDALMLLPYWTDGCIGSEEGLYYESSATTPYHFLNDAELSPQAPNPVRGLTYPSGIDVTEGIQHLQMMGDKYFMADTPDVEAAADADSNLLLVGSVGPYPVNQTSGSTTSLQQLTWKIYEVEDSALVAPLVNQPVVMNNVQSRNPQVWLNASESWYLDPSRWTVLEAASGPKSWVRVPSTQTTLPAKPLPAIQVSDIVQSNQSISFDVDQVGVPVVVKVSYFPNWQVSGAQGPYRVTPNLMVVIPTSNHVVLNYGYTPVDWIGFILSLFGLASLVVFWRLGQVEYAPIRGGRQDPLMFWASPDPDKVPPRMPPTFDAAGLDQVFKAYDIRGTVPDQLNPALARAVGAAFAQTARATTILVSRDMRPSGIDLLDAFADGVTSAGVNVVDLGLTSTDEMYFASGYMNAPGAMFTASHNPAQYNGIKLCRAGARPVGEETGLREIKSAVLAGHLAVVSPARGSVTQVDVLAAYVEKVRSFVDLAGLRPLKVVADTANGMGGLVVPAVFDGLPFQLEVLFGELDGTFPNHPADPIQPENLISLQERIRETSADVGLAFDGDADRCFLVDELGVPLSGSTTTALVASAMLDKKPGATILYNLICSKAVPEIIREKGGIPVRTRVGHSFIKAIMADTDALFGGEHSGHYYFRDNYRADSGSIAALVVLEVLSKRDAPLSEIRKEFERYADSGEINTEVGDQHAVIESLAQHYTGANQDRLDGLTVDFGDWWFNVRPSNTEPLLRLNLEAPDRQTCDARTAEVLSLITGRDQRSDADGA